MPSAADVGASATGHTHGPTDITGATPSALLRTNGSGVGVATAPTADVLTLLDATTRSGMRAAMDAASTAHASTHNPLGGDPLDDNVWALKSYTNDLVNATVGGLLYKRACRAVATANVATLSGTTTLDDVALVADDRVLLTNQTDTTENGPWVVMAGVWGRPNPSELQASAAFPVSEGTTYADTLWYITTNDPILVGVTGLTVARAVLTVVATQITDSGAAGRSVLQAATAANGRSALAVQDGPRLLPLLSAATPNSATPSVAGYARFTPASYEITGRTTALALTCIGQVSGAGLTGTLELLDCADDSVVATLTWTETAPTAKSAAVTLPGAAKTYRARVSCTGVTNPATEYALLGGANISITWS